MTIDPLSNTEPYPTSKLKGLPPIATATPRCILLIDADEESQQRRARVLRQRGVDVTCADDIEHAKLLWQEDKYSLVMIDVTNIYDEALVFQKSIKDVRPKQMVKFFVGKPGLLSDSPPAKGSATNVEEKISIMKHAQAVYAQTSQESSRGTGIKSATSRIATQRSLNRHEPVDRGGTEAKKETFGEAVRRVEDQS
jgi:DNA-binding NtrC family response regulator